MMTVITLIIYIYIICYSGDLGLSNDCITIFTALCLLIVTLETSLYNGGKK